MRPDLLLTAIINTLDAELDVVGDEATQAVVAHAVRERGQMIQNVAGEKLRATVAQLRAAGWSHSEIANLLNVSRGRAQQLAGVPVRLVDGPRNGETIYAMPEKSGRPNRQLLVAAGDGTAIVSYWRRPAPEDDGEWVAEFHGGTRTPPDWTEDLTVR